MGHIYQSGHEIKEAMIKNGTENRRHPRRNARWRFEGYDKNKTSFVGRTENISESGLLIIVDQDCYNKFEIGNRIFIKFQFCYQAKIKHFQGVAVIKHVTVATEGRKLGIEFIKIDPDHQKWLSSFALKKI